MRLAPGSKLILGEHANETYPRNALEISHQYLLHMIVLSAGQSDHHTLVDAGERVIG
jgi:hypothetical protein